MLRNQSWLTLARYLYSLFVGATIELVILSGHDITLWRVGLAAIAVVLAGLVHAAVELACQKAAGD